MEWISTFKEAVDALVATGNKEASAYLEEGLVSIPPGLIGPNSNPSELFNWLQGRVRNTFTPLLSAVCEAFNNAPPHQSLSRRGGRRRVGGHALLPFDYCGGDGPIRLGGG